ncbi:hypothetical protein JCM15457_2059 [Liquorilactobacillus sucicola DSM 21376 = JCM 15457]|uniref:YdbS-like PH domain-containing protein n=1 Tax=Liquorilactobacillus sucicola DSM 21376 = JCM 15457 TaxID=1423806 RepID=A0A023CYX7_9LACO|nr:PH domain-containing protein [Liquorilactobacillus sucicola]KRN06645.1 hypothetical protein FD15_GL000195 [Liquorilactobacillus sucicola DSM 21376 = JCM 15457]GAJ27097.1 hypothetical protein JCM15457_2059 [Liquorilactobacillus sucicola DSM 21376 = JCM 15457]
MSKMQHFSWLMLLQRTVHNLRSWIFLLILVIFKNISNIKLLVLSVSIFTLLAISEAFYRWLSYRFSLDEKGLLVHYGFIFKHQLDIPYERIQAVHREVWFLFKPFNVAKLTIETAGSSSGKNDVVLEAVPEAIYRELEKGRTYGAQMAAEKEAPPLPLYQVSLNDLLVFTFTNVNFISMLLAACGIYSEVGNLAAKKWLETQVSEIIAGGVLMIAILVLFVLIASFLIVLVGNLLRYFHFFVWRTHEHLVIERGLFTRRRVSIPVYRIQALQLRQSLLRSLLGLQAVEVILAAGQNSNQKEDVKDDTFYLLPIIRDKEVWQVLQTLLPEWKVAAAAAGTEKSHWFLFTRFRLLALMVFCPTLIYFFNFWWSLALACIMLFFISISLWSAHIQTVALDNALLHTVTVAGISRVETLCPLNKIQALKIKTSYYLEQHQLGHFVCLVKAGRASRHINLRYLALSNCFSLKKEVLEKHSIMKEN